MTLLGTIQNANNALIAAQLGLQVAGNNIANANTPGYIRQRLVQSPAPLQKVGTLLLGLGVQVDGVQQVIDKFLAERLRNATSDLAAGEAQANTYAQLESLINELGDNDLSTALTSFFGSLHDVLNQPESAAVRNVAVQEGRALAEQIRRLDQQVRTAHQDVNQQIAGMANEINDLLAEIADLNLKIVSAEGGTVSPSDAVGLRDQREIALAKLAEITDIRSIEQPTGDVTVFSGGEFLVNLGIHRTIEVVHSADDGLGIAELQIQDIGYPLTAGGGKLSGLMTSRDTILRGFLDGLDQFTRTLTFEFNKVFSGGQGLSGYSSLTSEFGVSNAALALDQAGLEFTPENGQFQIQVTNSQTGVTRTFDIRVDLNGVGTETTLNDLAAQLDAADGISASVTADGELQITADAPEITFAFAADTSGALAALGINTFFSGSGASTIGISQVLRSDPKKLAMSSGGVAADTKNGLVLANLITEPLASRNGESLATLYDRLTNDVAQNAQTTRGATDGFRVFQQALEAQHQAISGVNLDEEAVRMIALQRVFQASARVIKTVDEMLEILVNL
ncbi:MAG TPA: flagellar hook-associated protein FlgK [Pirellulaceae bacterium]|nr:flagellar hook-associated protein FlgK [Pirellulaceae bacterium]